MYNIITESEEIIKERMNNLFYPIYTMFLNEFLKIRTPSMIDMLESCNLDKINKTYGSAYVEDGLVIDLKLCIKHITKKYMSHTSYIPIPIKPQDYVKYVCIINMLAKIRNDINKYNNAWNKLPNKHNFIEIRYKQHIKISEEEFNEFILKYCWSQQKRDQSFDEWKWSNVINANTYVYPEY